MTTPITRLNEQYRFLSNFWPVWITVEGIEYPSVEHAFQASKSFDQNQRLTISKIPDPGQAKRYGKKVALRAGWDAMKVNVMYGLLQRKFRDPTLRAELLDTGERELIEGNWWGDTFWGVCNGVGENMLGKLLMRVRKEIRQG